MLVEFDQMPAHVRVWIYMSDREITPGDAALIDGVLTGFTTEWAAHGVPLRSSYKILQDRFVVLAVDEETHGPSGCSIDASVNVMKNIGKQTGIDFFDRKRVPFLIENQVVLIGIGELKEKYRTGVWNGQTLTFNILAGTLGGIRDHWTLPATKSWVNRYMEPLGQDSLAG